MTQTGQNLTVWQHETLTSTVTITDSEGSVKNLTGMQEAIWSILDLFGNTILQLSYTENPTQVQISDPALGKLQLSLTAAQTAAFEPRIYFHQLYVKDNADVEEYVLEGAFDIREAKQE